MTTSSEDDIAIHFHNGEVPPNYETPPTYIENEGSQTGTEALITILLSRNDGTPNPFGDSLLFQTLRPTNTDSKGPPAPESHDSSLVEAILQEPDDDSRQYIVQRFFDSIYGGHVKGVALFVNNSFVTANTTNDGKTPLLAAVAQKDAEMVKKLIELGADVDAFGVKSRAWSTENYQQTATITIRTPLQLAAEIGHLPLVKLLMEVYHSDDSIVAPDGQIALRLAAENGHREVVDYLPARRAGGFRRWQHSHRLAIARARRALGKVYRFCKFFLWDIEVVLLFVVPKYLIYDPIKKRVKWCWDNRKEFGTWCKHQAQQIPIQTKRVGKFLWKGIKAIPKGIANAGKGVGKAVKGSGKAIWKFGTETLPLAVKAVVKWIWRFFTQALPRAVKAVVTWIWRFFTQTLPRAAKAVGKWIWKFSTVTLPRVVTVISKWIWNLITTKIPNAIDAALKWIFAGLKAVGMAIGNVLMKLASLLHTILSAVATFFRSLTFADIWNGVREVLKAIFVTFPTTLWQWVLQFGDVSWRMSKAMFGTLGELFWYIVFGVGYLILYVPRKLFEALQSLGGSFARAWYEVLVFFKPKA